MIVIEGYEVKELRCKNDDCRSLLGYDNLKLGVVFYKCQKCGYLSKFAFGYNTAAKKFMQELSQKFPTPDPNTNPNP